MGLVSYGDTAIQGLATNYPDLLRQELHSPEWRGLFLSAFKSRLAARKRDAIALYAKAVQLIDSREDLLLVIVRELGVRDKGELGALVTSGKRLAQLAETPPATMLHDAEQVMRMVIQKDPACRTDARRICHTLLQVLDGLSSAEEVNGTP